MECIVRRHQYRDKAEGELAAIPNICGELGASLENPRWAHNDRQLTNRRPQKRTTLYLLSRTVDMRWKRKVDAEHRKSRRRNVFQPALMVDYDGSIIGPCTMFDVSAGGARLKVGIETAIPPDFLLHLSKFDTTTSRRCAVVWRIKAETGIRFLSE